MAIIVSKNGKNASKLNKVPYGLEDNLQQFIYNNPESIPLYDIKEDVQLLILAREYGTLSGPIDAVGIDKEGEIYLIETKLYKNPDKRTVIAQVLDYGASLWKTHPDLESFLLQINTATQRNFQQTVRERMQNYYSLNEEDVEELINNIGVNLSGGNFKFVVLMDTIHDQLKDLILYMNQNSKFDIYGVELEFYKHGEFEITIPKLFGAEIKKNLTTMKTDTTFISDEEFISLYAGIGLESKIKEILQLSKDMQAGVVMIDRWVARRTPKNINFTYKPSNSEKDSLSLSLPYVLDKPELVFNFWFYDKPIESILLDEIEKTLEIKTKKLQLTAKYGVVAKWPVREFSTSKVINFFTSLSNKT